MTEQAVLEALGHELFKGQAINHDAWTLKDKAWVKQRAIEWKELKTQLSHDYLDLSRTQLKALENYYLKGKVPKFNSSSLVTISLVYLCWLHPDQTDENWQLIKDVIWLIGGEYAKEHHRLSIELVMGGGYCEDEGFPNGLMGGLEERIFNFLIDDVECQYVKFNCDERLTKFGDVEARPYAKVFDCCGFDTFLTYEDRYTGRHDVWQYDRPLEYWYASLRKEKIESVIGNHRKKNKLLRFLDAVAQYDVVSDPTHHKSIYVKKVRKILNERPIPSQLQALWEEAKSKVE